MIKNEKEKFYLIFMAFLLGGLILVWQGIIESEAAIRDSASEIKDKNLAIAAYAIRKETLARNLESYNLVKDKLEEINGYFIPGGENLSVDKQNLPDFIKRMEDIADATSNSLTIDFINEADSAPKSAPAEKKSAAAKNPSSKMNDSYALRINLKGGFDELVAFIARFESVPYYSYIDSVIINAEPSSAMGGGADKKYFSGAIRSALVIRVFKNKNFNSE